MTTEQIRIGEVVISKYKGGLTYHIPIHMDGVALRAFKTAHKSKIQKFKEL